jgi:hypothetical protein
MFARLKDYLWGRLHRLILNHPLGGPFSIPPGGSEFPPTFDDLAGIPVDGGFGVVDASNHSVRADSSDEFMFDSGPASRAEYYPILFSTGKVVSDLMLRIVALTLYITRIITPGAKLLLDATFHFPYTPPA